MSRACERLAHSACRGCDCICHLDSVAPVTSTPTGAADPQGVLL